MVKNKEILSTKSLATCWGRNRRGPFLAIVLLSRFTTLLFPLDKALRFNVCVTQSNDMPRSYGEILYLKTDSLTSLMTCDSRMKKSCTLTAALHAVQQIAVVVCRASSYSQTMLCTVAFHELILLSLTSHYVTWRNWLRVRDIVVWSMLNAYL